MDEIYFLWSEIINSAIFLIRGFKNNIEWNAGEPKDEIEDSEVIQLRSIASYLNGVARVVYFKRDGNHIQLKSVMEGQMIHGQFEGFAR